MGDYTLPLGKARLLAEGSDVTLVGWGAQVRQAREQCLPAGRTLACVAARVFCSKDLRDVYLFGCIVLMRLSLLPASHMRTAALNPATPFLQHPPPPSPLHHLAARCWCCSRLQR